MTRKSAVRTEAVWRTGFVDCCSKSVLTKRLLGSTVSALLFLHISSLFSPSRRRLDVVLEVACDARGLMHGMQRRQLPKYDFLLVRGGEAEVWRTQQQCPAELQQVLQQLAVLWSVSHAGKDSV